MSSTNLSNSPNSPNSSFVFDEVTIIASSENSVLLTWPEKICPVQHQKIIDIEQGLKKQFGKIISESIVSYNSLILYYHFDRITFSQLCGHIAEVLSLNVQQACHHQTPPEVIEIAVYYSEESGWDLANLAKNCQLTIEQVIELHSQRTYHAYALGFTPGFCYLGTLDNALVVPRKASPRLSVPKGAVAIAEQQTAIYPNESPGGWHIIGQTPIAMYREHNHTFMPTIAVGQSVKFVPITKSDFEAMGAVVKREPKNTKGINP